MIAMQVFAHSLAIDPEPAHNFAGWKVHRISIRESPKIPSVLSSLGSHVDLWENPTACKFSVLPFCPLTGKKANLYNPRAGENKLLS